MAKSGSSRNPDADRPSASPSLAELAASGVPTILVVEDNEADVFLIQEAIQKAKFPAALHIVNDGEQAVRFFDLADQDIAMPCPALVILDINLPKRQGSEVLKHLRQSSRCGNALVVVVSTSESARDREQMEKLDANRYFRKPSGYEQFMQLGEIVKTLLSNRSSQ